MSVQIKDLEKSVQSAATKTFKAMNNSTKLKKKGVESVIITETRRDLAVQMAYYSRSRMKDSKFVKEMYKAGDGNNVVLYFKDAIATFYSFGEKPREIRF